MEKTVFEQLQEYNPSLYKLFEECVAKIITKNHDYAGKGNDFYRNLKSSERWGFPGWKSVFVRLGDKFARLENFMAQEIFLVNDESFRDTCEDAANYLLFMADMFESSNAKPETLFGYPIIHSVSESQKPLEFRDLRPPEKYVVASEAEQPTVTFKGILNAETTSG